MAGLEIWSGVGLILGPPIGGLIYPSLGVPGVFLSLSLFPLAMLLAVPSLRYVHMQLLYTGSHNTAVSIIDAFVLVWYRLYTLRESASIRWCCFVVASADNTYCLCKSNS